MNLIDHDDFSWLVYADWLEERGDILSDHIRFQVLEDDDTWSYEYYLESIWVGGAIIGGRVGGRHNGDIGGRIGVGGGFGLGSIGGGGSGVFAGVGGGERYNAIH